MGDKHKKQFKKKDISSTKRFFLNNACVFIWIGAAIIIELINLVFVGCIPVITSPWFGLCLILLVLSVLFFIPNRIAKICITSVLLAGQTVICCALVALYECKGGCIFYFDLILVTKYGEGYVTGPMLNWIDVGVCVALCVCFVAGVVLLEVYTRRHYVNKKIKFHLSLIIINSLVLTTTAMTTLLEPMYCINLADSKDFQNLLYYKNNSSYQSDGLTATAVSQFVGAATNKVDTSNLNVVDNALQSSKIYNPESKISENNNLIMFTVESLDWFPFTLYYDSNTVETIFPNITSLMKESIVFDNYYTREGSDVSEINALMGSNPIYKTLNYGFPHNEYPYSLPNCFKSKYPNAVTNALQSDTKYIYNCYETLPSLGFDHYWPQEVLKSTYGIPDTMSDSNVMDTMKTEMFPTDKQFFSYWFTLGMHGGYDGTKKYLADTSFTQDGVNYSGYYDFFDKNNVFPYGKNDNCFETYLRNYAAKVKDFDRAIGIMMDYLETKNLLDKTTILVYGDHFAYMNYISLEAKGIYNYYNNELFRIPAMIYDQKLVNSYKTTHTKKPIYGTNRNDASYPENQKCLTISKFVTTIDFAPTVFDLLNIKVYRDLYPGSSVLKDDKESIIYSKTYNEIFATNKLSCYSANDLKWKYDGFTDADYNDFVSRAKEFLRIKEITDKIYYSNYFKKHEYINPNI